MIVTAFVVAGGAGELERFREQRGFAAFTCVAGDPSRGPALSNTHSTWQ